MAKPFQILSASVEETHAFGKRLGRLLRPGDVLALRGELGTGKTTLIQGIASGLGLDPAVVKSPTFVLVREYPVPSAAGGGTGGAATVTHVDGYRLSGAPAAAWLDVELLIGPTKITLIEWAERFEGLLPDDHLEIRLEHVSTNRRRLTLMPHGGRAEALVAESNPSAQEASHDAARD